MRWFPNRKHPRKRAHDYTLPGAYFVTFTTHLREPRLAHFARNRLVLLPLGETVTRLWAEVPRTFPTVHVDTFVIMPDHVHALLLLGDETTDRPVSLSDVVRWIKGCAAHEHRSPEAVGHVPIWQASFHDRIICDSPGMARVRRYIEMNPYAANPHARTA